MTEAPQDTPKKRSTSSVLTLAIIGTLLAVFVGVVLFYPSGEEQEYEPGAGGPFGTKLQEGKPVPDFSLTDTDGKQWNLAELRGSVVLVNFWATWCPPCRQEMPSISRLHTATAVSDKMKILTILYRDDPEAAKAYFKENEFTMPILLDPGGQVARAYGLTGVPESYIVDKQGILRRAIIGPSEFDTPDATRFFVDLLNE